MGNIRKKGAHTSVQGSADPGTWSSGGWGTGRGFQWMEGNVVITRQSLSGMDGLPQKLGISLTLRQRQTKSADRAVAEKGSILQSKDDSAP